jgi:hypothetical protein
MLRAIRKLKLNRMKDQTPIFRDHPALQGGEEEMFLREILPNAMTVAAWLKKKPELRSMKVAAIVEATNSRRPAVLDRLLGPIFKHEKALAFEKLLNLKDE